MSAKHTYSRKGFRSKRELLYLRYTICICMCDATSRHVTQQRDSVASRRDERVPRSLASLEGECIISARDPPGSPIHPPSVWQGRRDDGSAGLPVACSPACAKRYGRTLSLPDYHSSLTPVGATRVWSRTLQKRCKAGEQSKASSDYLGKQGTWYEISYLKGTNYRPLSYFGTAWKICAVIVNGNRP